MSKDILIGFFFACKDIDLIADRQHEFLLFAMGARTAFAGKDPKSAHRELPPILKGHFDRRLTLLKEVLEDYSLSDEDIRTWIDFEAAFRPVVETETHQKSS